MTCTKKYCHDAPKCTFFNKIQNTIFCDALGKFSSLEKFQKGLYYVNTTLVCLFPKVHTITNQHAHVMLLTDSLTIATAPDVRILSPPTTAI